MPYLELGQGELASKQARSHSLRRDFVFGERASVTTDVAAKTKAACKRGRVRVAMLASIVCS